jgi:hypothetical protein
MVLNLLTIDIILTTLKDISIFHICEKRFNILHSSHVSLIHGPLK